MSLRIHWTSESEKTFNQNLEYLSKEWDTVVLNRFLDRVEEVIETVKANPKLYPVHSVKDNVRKCVIHERIVLYYKIVDEEIVDLLTFWNTYRDPSMLNM